MYALKIPGEERQIFLEYINLTRAISVGFTFFVVKFPLLAPFSAIFRSSLNRIVACLENDRNACCAIQ